MMLNYKALLSAGLALGLLSGCKSGEDQVEPSVPEAPQPSGPEQIETRLMSLPAVSQYVASTSGGAKILEMPRMTGLTKDQIIASCDRDIKRNYYPMPEGGTAESLECNVFENGYLTVSAGLFPPGAERAVRSSVRLEFPDVQAAQDFITAIATMMDEIGGSRIPRPAAESSMDISAVWMFMGDKYGLTYRAFDTVLFERILM